MPPLSLPSENYHLTQHLSSLSDHWAARGGVSRGSYSSGSHRGMIQATNQGYFFPLGQSPLDFPHQEPLHKVASFHFPSFSDVTNSYFPFILISVFWSLFLFSVVLLSGTEDLETWATISRQGVKRDPKGPPIPWNTWFL